MLGLRFFVCEDCETVFAGVEEPATCGDCDGERFAEITDALQREPYFVPE